MILIGSNKVLSMDKITGQDLINYINKHDLQDATVEVSAIIQGDGDHENLATDQISLQWWEHRKRFSIFVGDTLG